MSGCIGRPVVPHMIMLDPKIASRIDLSTHQIRVRISKPVVVHIRFYEWSTSEDKPISVFTEKGIMMNVHEKGRGIAGGPYSKEIAETKVTNVMDFARQNGHPLKATFEKE